MRSGLSKATGTKSKNTSIRKHGKEVSVKDIGVTSVKIDQRNAKTETKTEESIINKEIKINKERA